MQRIRARESRNTAHQRPAPRLEAHSSSEGVPLPSALQAPMERAFSHSFADVRVHADANADAMTQSHGARALTIDNDVFFRDGAWRPGDAQATQLLAHELAHVVQFEQFGTASTGNASGTSFRETTEHAEGAESEARTAAATVMSGGAPVITSAPSAAIARDDDEPLGPSFSLLPPKFNYGLGIGGGNANLSLGAGGLGADYSRGMFHGDASLGFGGSTALNLGIGAPLLPWNMDVNRDLGGAAGGVNSLMNGGGLTSSTVGALGGFSALGDIAAAGKPTTSPWGLGLQLSHSDEESRAMLGARFDF